MYSSKAIRNCLIPTISAAFLERKGKSKHEDIVCTTNCRPSELPIYTPEPKREIVPPKCEEEDSTMGALETALRNTRVKINKYQKDFEGYKRVGLEHFDRIKGNMDGALDYLQEENNTTPKAGAIGIGALTGFVFGLRGGLIKKTLYAATGALGMAAVCYPNDARQYSQTSIQEAKKYFTIAYNFIYGVKKGDPPLELPSLPKIPTSFAEAWDSVKSTATSFVSENKIEKIELKEAEEQVPKEGTDDKPK